MKIHPADRKKLYRAIAALTLGSAISSVRALVPEYTIFDLATLGGGTSEANGINNAGRIIGTSLTAGGATRAFLTSPNSAINPATDALPLLSGGTLNKAYGLNATGQVAGWGNSSDGERAYRFSAGASTAFNPISPGELSYGQAINASGQLVGTSSTKKGANPPFQAVLYSGTTIKDLGVTVSGDNSYAYGITTNGAVVGFSADGQGSGRADAFLWTPTTPNGTTGSMVALNNDLGGNYSYAYAINDAGQIVGEATGSGDDSSHAFLRSAAGIMSDLGTLIGSTSSKAFAINAGGLVVGQSRDSSTATRAFLYADGAMRDLNALIPAGSGWSLAKATSINDSAQIVGAGTFGGVLRAFLLNPVPMWAVDSDGNWTTTSNWLGGSPSGIGVEVRLTGAISAPRTITLDSPRVAGHVVFDNAHTYTLSGGMLSIRGPSFNTGIEVRSGAHVISAPVHFEGAATLNLATNSGLKFAGTISGPVKHVALASGATLDINGNDLLINYDPAGGSPLATVATAIASASNGGAWNGPGITSSTAATVSGDALNPHKTALGYAEAHTVGITGADIDSSTVIIRYTLSGDANLDGRVNALDFNTLASNFGTTDRKWYEADFDYSGTIDSTDFTLLAANFGQSIALPASGLGSVVPEPATISIGAFALLLCGRRRNRPARSISA